MKLNKNIREAFVRAAMNDVPEIDYAQQARDIAIKAVQEKMPEEVKKIAGNDKTSCWLSTEYVYMPGRFSGFPTIIPQSTFLRDQCPKVYGQLKKLSELADEQDSNRETLRRKLWACAESVTTRKALGELLPEFEKYLPADERAAIKTLPAVANVVADFAAAGWPKGNKTARKAA